MHKKSILLPALVLLAGTPFASQAKLVGYWDMDIVDNGQPNAISGKPCTAINAATPTQVTNGAPGSQRCLSVARSGYLATGETPASLGIDGSKARTLVAWVRTTKRDRDYGIMGFSPTNGALNSREMRMRIQKGRLRFEVSGAYVLHDQDVADGAWHMLAVAYPAGGTLADVVFYIDGKRIVPSVRPSANLVPATDAGATDELKNQLIIGADSAVGTDRGLDGEIDEVRIYDEALDADAISKLFDAQKVTQGGLRTEGRIINSLGTVSGPDDADQATPIMGMSVTVVDPAGGQAPMALESMTFQSSSSGSGRELLTPGQIYLHIYEQLVIDGGRVVSWGGFAGASANSIDIQGDLTRNNPMTWTFSDASLVPGKRYYFILNRSPKAATSADDFACGSFELFAKDPYPMGQALVGPTHVLSRETIDTLDLEFLAVFSKPVK